MSAYVVVHLAATRSVARARGERAEPRALSDRKVKQLLTEHGAELIGDPGPSPATDAIASATLAVADMACAEKLAAALRNVDGIETAYAKPGEELP